MLADKEMADAAMGFGGLPKSHVTVDKKYGLTPLMNQVGASWIRELHARLTIIRRFSFQLSSCIRKKVSQRFLGCGPDMK